MRHPVLVAVLVSLGVFAGRVTAHAQPAAGPCLETETPLWITTVRGAGPFTRIAPPLRGLLPACASPLMRSIHRATMSAATGSTIAADLITTSMNAAEPDALEQGPEIFGRMRELIADAEREVLLQNWRWDSASRAHASVMDGLRALSDRRKRTHPDGPPVAVRILVNVRAFESPRMLPLLARSIERLGLDPKAVDVQIGGHTHLGLGALHTKSLVVDGRSAVVTGANVQKNHDTFDHNYDLGFTFHGEVARSLRAEFEDAWADSHRWGCGSGGTIAWDVLGIGASPCWMRTSPLRSLPLHLQLPAPSVLRACLPMMVVTRPAAQSPFANSDHNPQNQAFLAAIRGARSRIRIMTPNLNDEAVKEALASAIARGVTVDIVIGKGYQDFAELIPTRGGTNNQAFKAILKLAREKGATEPCRNFRPRWYTRDGRNPVVGNVDESIHAKYMSIDGALSIVGSGNLDEQSFNNSREVNVVVDDPATTAGWDAQVFDAEFRRGLVWEGCAARGP